MGNGPIIMFYSKRGKQQNRVAELQSSRLSKKGKDDFGFCWKGQSWKRNLKCVP
jgi:hypothetical protein